MNNYLKLPCELALFALREDKIKQAACYTASHLIYSGNAHSSDKPVHTIASATGYPSSSVYRYFDWLISRNWFGKNKYGRYYFRGIDRVHKIEGWKFARAAIMHKKDLQNIKAFFTSVVCASLALTREGNRREQASTHRFTRSKLPASPISLFLLEDVLDVSQSTAYRLRKLAADSNYINNDMNMVQITNLQPDDLKHAKANHIEELPVELFGHAGRRITAIDRIRYKKKKLFLQEPNLVQALIEVKSRRNISTYSIEGR